MTNLLLTLALLLQTMQIGIVASTPPSSAATIARSGSSAVQNTCTTTCAITLSPATNSFVIVRGMYRDDTCSFTNVTDNGSGGSNTYTTLYNTDLDGHRSLILAYAQILHGSVTTVTVNLSIACQGGFIAQAYTGIATSSPNITFTATFATATSATQTTNSVVTAVPNAMITSACFNNTSTAAFTATAPNTLIANETIPTDGSGYGAGDRLNVAPGTYTAGFTTAGSVQWFCPAEAWKSA